MVRKSKYKSNIIKQRKNRLWDEIDKTLDALNQSVTLWNEQTNVDAKQIIETSPEYAEINYLCTKVIPLFEDFSHKAIAFDAAGKRLLYTFDSDADWSRVKEFYTDWFSKQGWKTIDESDKLPHSDKIVVKTDNYKITLCDVSLIGGYLLAGEKA